PAEGETSALSPRARPPGRRDRPVRRYESRRFRTDPDQTIAYGHKETGASAGRPMPNHLVFIVMDSCRFDSYARAATPNMDRIGKAQQRYSFASWTSPSHYTFLMGQTPHTSPRRVFASEVYKEEFRKWVERLGIPNLSFKSFIPHLSLPRV